MKVEGTTIGITGVGGFIGSRMARRALQRGMKVKGFDSALGPIEALKAQLQGFGDSLDLFVGDVTDPKAAQRLCENCDIIFHAAAVLDVASTLENSRRVNVGGTIAVAEAARKARVRRFVHLSSVMVYGFSFPKYVTEYGPKRGENDPYCQTKIESEEAALTYHDKANQGMEVIVIRPGDVYGTRSVTWVLGPIVQMSKGILRLPNGGQGCINHVHVDNLLDACFLALENDQATGEAFNVTDGGSTTWLEFYSRLAEIAKVPKPPTFPLRQLITTMILEEGFAPPGTPTVPPTAANFLSRPHPYSIEKARTRLGYVPKITLDQGMQEIAAFLAKRNIFARSTVIQIEEKVKKKVFFFFFFFFWKEESCLHHHHFFSAQEKKKEEERRKCETKTERKPETRHQQDRSCACCSQPHDDLGDGGRSLGAPHR